MPEVQAARVTVVSLNTRGVPVAGSCLPGRYAVIGEAVEAGDADVACFQEVFSWWHLRLLARRMRSFGHVSFRAVAGRPGRRAGDVLAAAGGRHCLPAFRSAA